MSSPLILSLERTLGRQKVLSAAPELAVYDCDAFTIERHRPTAVVFPESTHDVVNAVKICGQYGAAVIPRGAGTSLAGGCLPTPKKTATGDSDCVIVMLTRLNKIVSVDPRNRMAVVEPGVANLRLARALAGSGFHFAPDPSSQNASTIGGNVATNAGGPHTLKYGVTINHIVGVEMVLGDGSVLQLGPVERPGSPDLVGMIVGSEGTLGIVTKIWIRLTPNPMDYRTMRATFRSIDDAGNAVSHIIAAGIIPAAMELMDQGILVAVEAAYHFGFPPDAGAVLVIEVDGPSVGLDRQTEQIVELCKKFGAVETLQAASAAERELLWKCRKMAVGATGRLSASYTIQDGVAPRTKLPHIIRRTTEVSKKYNVRIVNVAHAGDGNIHPIILFDERDREQVERVLAAGREILQECIASGGSVTAEHGVGVEKIAMMDLQFAPNDLDAMRHVRESFDPAGVLNPGKLIPAAAKSEATSEVADAMQSNKPSVKAETKIIDYTPDDMTITVAADLTIAELQAALAPRRQWLPVDVANADRTTVAEAILANAAGPRRYAYGTMRDYVLGFTAVDGRGCVFSGGGRVVKNAAGYNMCRLLAGSHGVFGKLLQATLMVRPRPELSSAVVCELPNLEMAETLLADLVHSQARPAAIELTATSASRRLCVGFEGTAAEVAWMIGRLQADWAAKGVASPVTTADAEPLWRQTTDFAAVASINVLPSQVAATIADILKTAPSAIVQSRAGNGEILIGAAESDLTMAARIAEAAKKYQPPPSEVETRVLLAIKKHFDPNNALATA